jgi:predicted O-methyltransferase YrrM
MAIPGFMEPDELAWLNVQASRYREVLEVGTWKGRSASALAAGCPGRVWTVDHFEGSPSEREAAHAEALTADVGREAELNLDRYGNVTILRLPSVSASRMFRAESLEMVLLDGDHDREGALVDLVAWRPKVSRLLCGHDRDWPGVYEALSIYGIPYETGPGSLWFMRTHP